MKNLILLSIVLVGSVFTTHAQSSNYEYKVITTVESIVPMGIGRSRIIESTEDRNHTEFTTERTGAKGEKNKTSRAEAKIEGFKETKLLNFYSGVGINFQNIASNDALLTSKLNELASDGWELAFTTSGVESDAGESDNKGIFITRFVFRRSL